MRASKSREEEEEKDCRHDRARAYNAGGTELNARNSERAACLCLSCFVSTDPWHGCLAFVAAFILDYTTCDGVDDERVIATVFEGLYRTVECRPHVCRTQAASQVAE